MRTLAIAFVLVTSFQGQNPPATELPPVAPFVRPVPAASPSPNTSPASVVTDAPSKEKLPLPRNAQDFKFTKVDLELLKQVNAFDEYMNDKGWVYNDPQTTAYLEKVALPLVPSDTPENVRWRFRAVRDLQVNAFALPNGSIYVNSGLLARMENEAQIAGVLAHEITHVTNRHTYLEYRSARKKMVAIDVILAAAGGAGYAGVNIGIVNALGNALPLIVVSTIFGYSLELEHEADVYAVNNLYLHGYDLRQFSRGFELLRKGPEVDLSQEPVFWASHPKLEKRVQYVAKMAEQLQPDPANLRIDEQPYHIATRNVDHNTAELAILMGQPRTAVAIGKRLTTDEPGKAANWVLLGDAYRTLGARTPVPEDEELTDKAKDQAREKIHKMTIAEYDKTLMAAPLANERWQANVNRSDEAFRKALTIDPAIATAHRGLGFLAERENQPSTALDEFRQYLQLAPEAKDARQIKLRVHALEEKVTLSSAPLPAESQQ